MSHRHSRSLSNPRFMDKRLLWAVVTAIVLVFLLGGTHTYKKYSPTSHVEQVVQVPQRPLEWGLPTGLDGHGNWQKPEDWKITAVIFYGRRQYVQILDCYLRKNLAVNGGYLDNVLFIDNTNDDRENEFLKGLLDEVPQYSMQKKKADHGFQGLWDDLVDEGTIYVKIDDDVVWMQEDSIPQLVHTLLENPEAYAVGGNMVNNPTCSFWHWRLGAIKAFMPELEAPNPPAEVTSWRPSTLPEYKGAMDPYPFHDGMEDPDPVYHEHQRMLPIRNDTWQLQHTPIADSHWGDGRAWKNWVLAAQQHMSLFDHLEKDTVGDYVFGMRPMNLHFDRYNIVFMAIRGGDVALNLPGTDDEHDLTVRNPTELGRPFLLDTKALCAHFGFHPQSVQMGHTDILQRYKLYAGEKVCAAPLGPVRPPLE